MYMLVWVTNFATTVFRFSSFTC